MSGSFMYLKSGRLSERTISKMSECLTLPVPRKRSFASSAFWYRCCERERVTMFTQVMQASSSSQSKTYSRSEPSSFRPTSVKRSADSIEGTAPSHVLRLIVPFGLPPSFSM